MVIGCTIREVDEPMAAVLWCEEIELQITRRYRMGISGIASRISGLHGACSVMGRK